MQTAFVVGATGLVGRELVAALRAAGHETIAHVRPDSSRLEHWRAHFEGLGAQVSCAAFEVEALADALRQAQPVWIFSLLGTTKKRMAKEGGDYQSIDYGLTRRLIDAAAQVGFGQDNPEARFVYLSAVGVHPKTRNAYMRARADAEAALEASGLPYTFARPSIILGERDEPRPLERWGGVVADGALGLATLLGGRALKARYASTTAPILARALLRAAQDPALRDGIAEGAALRFE